MAGKNRKCLGCGESYHCCSSCDMPEWGWTYCREECWAWSFRAVQLLALGVKIGALLETHELALLKEATNESHHLDKVLEGVLLPRE